jgi:hypothetical protein
MSCLIYYKWYRESALEGGLFLLILKKYCLPSGLKKITIKKMDSYRNKGKIKNGILPFFILPFWINNDRIRANRIPLAHSCVGRIHNKLLAAIAGKTRQGFGSSLHFLLFGQAAVAFLDECLLVFAHLSSAFRANLN